MHACYVALLEQNQVEKAAPSGTFTDVPDKDTFYRLVMLYVEFQNFDPEHTRDTLNFQ